MTDRDVRHAPAAGAGAQDSSLGDLLGNVGVVALGVGKFLWSAGEAAVEVVGTVAEIAGTVVEVAGTVVEVVADVLGEA
jgi:hypothetical protein